MATKDTPPLEKNRSCIGCGRFQISVSEREILDAELGGIHRKKKDYIQQPATGGWQS